VGLESGDLISNLDILWPLEIDPTHQGNEHLQLIKRVIQKTFPGRSVGGAEEGGWDGKTLVNPEELDLLIGATTPLSDTQDLIKIVDGTVVVGVDDNSTPMDIHTNEENTLVQKWNDGQDDIVATIMNALNVVDHIYPIGSYLERDGTAPDPNVQYGGTTWIPVVGYVTLGAGVWDEGGPDETTYVVDEVGGEIEHTLIEDEMPIHTHRVGRLLNAEENTGTPRSDYLRTGTINGPYTASAGGDQPHNNMQPYIVVNKWKRTA